MALPIDRRNGASATRPSPELAPVTRTAVAAVPVWVRWVTTVSVLAVAGVAAVASYESPYVNPWFG
jgi:hypothetical protein